MTNILVTFLGRASRPPEAPPAPGKAAGRAGYRTARYELDGDVMEETSFLGLALARRLEPDKLVVLGTAGSMWDYLIEATAQPDELEQERLELMEAAERLEVTQDLLGPLEPLLQQHTGCECRLAIIPNGRTLDEQLAILSTMADAVEPGDRLSLDLTHGFRHLPMLGFLSALYLRQLKGVAVQGLYYGALDMSDRNSGITPVLRLDGLLSVADWVGAMASFSKDGDYGVFASLLVRAGISEKAVQALRMASYFERIHDLGRAKKPAAEFADALERSSLSGTAVLFKQPLLDRLRRLTNGYLEVRQRSMALFHLQQGDFLRAAILGFEAFISQLVKLEKGSITKWHDREKAKNAFEKRKPGRLPTAYLALRELRNTLAHGSPARHRQVQQAISSPTKLRDAVSLWLGELPWA